MMQHVATAKSEVAAFATGAETNSFTGSESNEQFGKLLQEQKSVHSETDKPERIHLHKPSKETLQQSTDEVSKQPSSAVTAVTEDAIIQVESTSNEDALKETDTKAELQLALSSKQDDIESEPAAGKGSIVTQDWVALVEKLADSARPEKSYEIEGGVPTPEDIKLDFGLPYKVEKDLLEKVADKQIVDNFKVTIDDIAPDIVQEDSKVPNDNALVTKKPVEQNISILVDKALSEVLTTAEVDGLTEVDVRQKAVELLLEQPEVLQDLISQLQVASQKSGADSGTNTTEQKILDTTIETAIKQDSLLAGQHVEAEGQTDLTLAENKALLAALLVVTEADKTNIKEPVKLAPPVASDTAEKLAKIQQAEAGVTTAESIIQKDELLDKSVQVAQVVPSNNDIKNILNLTDNKRDKVLENIAQRVFEDKKAAAPIIPEQIAQQMVTPKAAEFLSFVEPSSKDFIAALKSGLEEFKNQLSQGREPGIDLKSLISDALAKTTDTAVVVKTAVNLEQIVNSVSQVLDLAQTMSRTIENRHDQAFSASMRDVAQIQGEQSKQIQLNQFESKFEKAINIAKPEGHQQLAEKVRWMVNTKNLVAEIRLDPAELGSVHVKVAVTGESATVNFVVQSQQARDAVDTATPRLREMLAEKGIELGQSSVRQESDGQQGQDDELAKQGGGKGETEELDMPEQVLAQQNIVNGALGGIDYFV